MTDQTPIDRASSYIITKPRVGARTYREYARDAFESIDTDKLAEALKYDGWEGHDEPLTERDLTLIARAVKNWLTGNN